MKTVKIHGRLRVLLPDSQLCPPPLSNSGCATEHNFKTVPVEYLTVPAPTLPEAHRQRL